MKIGQYLLPVLLWGTIIITFSCNKRSSAEIEQRNKDSLAIIKAFNGIMLTYAGDQKKALAKIDSILPEIKKRQFVTFQMKLYGFLITESTRKNDTLKARAYIDSIKYLANHHKDSIYQCIYQMNAGNVESYFGSREKAFVHYSNSLSYIKI